MSNESSEHELPIRDGGEDMRIFDIMDRYRSDGSCERIIQTALIQMAKAQQAEADAQREPELSNAEIAHKLYEICCDEDRTWEYCEEQIQAALDAKDTRSRPTVEAAEANLTSTHNEYGGRIRPEEEQVEP